MAITGLEVRQTVPKASAQSVGFGRGQRAERFSLWSPRDFRRRSGYRPEPMRAADRACEHLMLREG